MSLSPAAGLADFRQWSVRRGRGCRRNSASKAFKTNVWRLYQALEPLVGSFCPGLARTPYHVHRYGARPE